MRACSAGGTPSPWSRTEKRIRPSCSSRRTSTWPPSGEYLTALSRRFTRTWRTLSGSPATAGRPAGGSSAKLVRGGVEEVGLHLVDPSLGGQVAKGVCRALFEADSRQGDPQLPIADLERHRLRRILAGSRRLADRNQGCHLRPSRNRLDERVPDDVPRGQSRDRLGSPVPEPDHALAVDEEDAVVHVREDERSMRALLRLAEETSVLNRETGALRELLDELEIALVVLPARLRRDEGHCPEDALAAGDRHRHGGCHPDAPHGGEGPRVASRHDDHLVGA